MALLPPSFLRAVMAVGFRRPDGVQWAGTAFAVFVANTKVANDRYHGDGYLVTNRHVLVGAQDMVIRCNPNSGPAREYDLDLRTGHPGAAEVVFHPNPDIDVAVVSINLEVLQRHGMDVSPFMTGPAADPNHVMDRTDLASAGVIEGDGAFVLGFPMSMIGGDRNYVVVRSGCISRIRDTLQGGAAEFLVDAHVFPGNSGGPVVLRPDLTVLAGTSQQQRAALIGMVKSYVPYHDVAISQQTGRPRVVFEENTGLTAVVPVDYILETIGHAGAKGAVTSTADVAHAEPAPGAAP